MKNLLFLLLIPILSYSQQDKGTDTLYTCFEKTIDIKPKIGGGGEPFDILWDDGTTIANRYNVGAGLYDLSIWNVHGCGIVKHYLVRELTPFEVYIETIKPTCKGLNDGKFIIDVSGSCPPYKYYLNGKEFWNTIYYNIAPGTYQFRVVDSKNCQYNSNLIIPKADEKPFSSFSVSSKCNTLYFNTNGNYSPYKYEINGTTLLGNSYQIVDTGNINLTIISSQNCSFDTIINPKSVAEFTINDIIVKNPLCDKIQNGSISILDTGDLKFKWSHTELDTNILTNLEANVYYLTIVDVKTGCEIEKSFNLKYKDKICISIPTAISPNNDGLNDVWRLDNLNLLYPNCEVFVYNRWSELIFHSKGYDIPWNGKRDDNYPLPIDSYHYIINLNDEDGTTFTGQITIIR